MLVVLEHVRSAAVSLCGKLFVSLCDKVFVLASPAAVSVCAELFLLPAAASVCDKLRVLSPAGSLRDEGCVEVGAPPVSLCDMLWVSLCGTVLWLDKTYISVEQWWWCCCCC